MAQFKLTIECDNAAFDEPTPEVVRILRELADRLENNGLHNLPPSYVRDYNGNRVGQWEYKE